MSDWLTDAVVELQRREAAYREREDDPEYWSNVANGLSEAIDVLDELDRKRAANNLTEDND